MHILNVLACALLALPAAVYSQSGCSGSVATSNGGRKIGIVIDSSGSMVDTDPSNLRIPAGEAINAALITSASAGAGTQPDKVTVVDFDDSVRIVYPLGDPASASFDGIDSSGGTYIALGVKTAIDEITKNPADVISRVSGIVVFTDGEDSYVDELVDELNRAQGLGIRVSFGFLSPFDATSSQDPSILTAILATGGIYSTIGDAAAQAQFVSLVLSHGLTDTDNAGASSSLLLPGLATAGNVSSTSGPATFTYDAVSGEKLNFTVSSISAQTFDITLKDKTANTDVGSSSTDAFGLATVLFDASGAASLELSVGTKNATAGLFSVNLISSLNRTITVCGSTTNNGTKPNGTSTGTSKPSTPTPTSPPKFTGGAAGLQSYAMGAIFPLVVALGVLVI